MMSFAVSGAASGAPEVVLQSAVTVLVNNGFAITDRKATSATLTGPGLNSTRQNPLLGATWVELRIERRRLHLDAELGGVDSMRRFVTRFPILLGLGIGLSFCLTGGFVFAQQFGRGFGVPGVQGWQWLVVAIGTAMLPVAPWLIIGPMMARTIRERTERALTTLVQNAGYAAKAA